MWALIALMEIENGHTQKIVQTNNFANVIFFTNDMVKVPL